VTSEKNYKAPSAPDPRRWLALAVILFAGFMDLLDVTIVNVTVPSIMRGLHAGYAQAGWIVAGYTLAFAAVLIIAGRLGDIFGRKRLFLAGVAGFTLASALCGVAVGPGMLIATRFVQGAMAGTMVPQILAIIHATFPADERRKAYGFFGAVVGSASAAGLIVGGLLVQWNLFGLGWRPVFLVNVPVGLAAMVAGWFFIREARSPRARKAWSPLAVLGLFRIRTFTSGVALLLIFGIAFAAFFFAWTLYMQVGLGWTPMHAGLTAVCFALAASVASGLSVEMLTPRFGRRVLMSGALVNAVGFAGYSLEAAHYGPTINSWQMLAPLIVAGTGFGLVIAPIVDLILTDVPVAHAGSASGLLSTIQELGMALGVALAGAVLSAHLGAGPTRSYSTAFSITLWYPVGILGVFFAGLFTVPRKVRPRDLDAELEGSFEGDDIVRPRPGRS
jgi:MFS family permease